MLEARDNPVNQSAGSALFFSLFLARFFEKKSMNERRNGCVFAVFSNVQFIFIRELFIPENGVFFR